MSHESLPSLRPQSGVPKEGHMDPRTTEYPSIKLVLEPNVDKPASHKASWAFYHQEHKKELDILTSNLEELRLLRSDLSHERQETTQILSSLLEEVRQIKELFHASHILSSMQYTPLSSSSTTDTSGRSGSLSPRTPVAMHEW
ncbi:unnamed protein product [Fusarium graminearum]|nr:unnamed protein product [Fusarium graminearum]